MSGTGQLVLPTSNRWKYMAIGGVAVAAIALAAFMLLRSRNGDDEPRQPRAQPATAPPSERIPKNSGGSEVKAADDPAETIDPTETIEPADPAEPSFAGDTPASPESARTGPARQAKKRRADDNDDRGELYDAPRDSLRLPR